MKALRVLFYTLLFAVGVGATIAASYFIGIALTVTAILLTIYVLVRWWFHDYR